MRKETIVGLIPARAGSKRCPGKNTRDFFGRPLIAWTIKSAIESGIFTEVIVSTDSQETISIAEQYGAGALLRPAEISGDLSTDYEWVRHAVDELRIKEDAIGILRPTNPFRQPDTIRRCWEAFRADKDARSLRTVKAAREHPGKMWLERGRYLIPNESANIADMPNQALKTYYIQDGLYYINATSNLLHGKLTMEPVLPFFTQYPENLDINTNEDFWTAYMVKRIRDNMGGDTCRYCV